MFYYRISFIKTYTHALPSLVKVLLLLFLFLKLRYNILLFYSNTISILKTWKRKPLIIHDIY